MNDFYQLVQRRVENRSANTQNATRKVKNKKRSKFKKRRRQDINTSFDVKSVSSSISSEFVA